MSKVVEILLTVVLRNGKVTPPDAQCTARRKASSTPKGERPARSHGTRKETGEPGGVVQRVFGTSHAEGVVHRRVGPREWARSEAGGVRSAGAPKGAREAARRGTGNGPEKYGRLRPEGYSGPIRVLPRQLTVTSGFFHSPWGQAREPSAFSPCPTHRVPHPLSKVTSMDPGPRLDDSLLDDLDPAQRDAVTSTGAPLCILAGPGAGKTRVLTRRVAYRLATETADPGHVLVITFTRKAASELSTRLGRLGLRGQAAAGTFHAIALAQLRQRWSDEGKTPPSLLDRKAPILAPLVTPVVPARRCRCTGAAGGCRRRDRVGEGADDQPFALRGAKPSERLAALLSLLARSPRSTSATSGSNASAPSSTSTTCSSCAHEQCSKTRASPKCSTGSSAISSSTSSRTSTPCSCTCSRPGAPDAPTCASSATPTRRSTAGTARTQPRSRSSPTGSPGRRSFGSPRTTAPPRRSCASLPRCCPTSSYATRSNPTGPIPSINSYPTDSAEAAAVARRVRDSRGSTTSWRHIGVLARTNAQLTVLEEAMRAARVPCRVRGGNLLEQPEVRSWLRDPRHRGAGPLAPAPRRSRSHGR